MKLNFCFLSMAVVASMNLAMPATTNGDEPDYVVEAISPDGKYFCLGSKNSTENSFTVFAVDGRKIGESNGSACTFGNYRNQTVFVTTDIERNKNDDGTLSVSIVSLSNFEPIGEQIEMDADKLEGMGYSLSAWSICQLGRDSDSFVITMSNNFVLIADVRQRVWSIVVPGTSKVSIISLADFSKLDSSARFRLCRNGRQFEPRYFPVSGRSSVFDFVRQRRHGFSHGGFEKILNRDVAAIISCGDGRPTVVATIDYSFMDLKHYIEYQNRVYFPSPDVGRINVVATSDKSDDESPQATLFFEIDVTNNRRLPPLRLPRNPDPIGQVIHCSTRRSGSESVFLFVSSFVTRASRTEQFLSLVSKHRPQEFLQLPTNVQLGAELKVTAAGSRLFFSGLFEENAFLAILDKGSLSWSEIDLESLQSR